MATNIIPLGFNNFEHEFKKLLVSEIITKNIKGFFEINNKSSWLSNDSILRFEGDLKELYNHIPLGSPATSLFYIERVTKDGVKALAKKSRNNHLEMIQISENFKTTKNEGEIVIFQNYSGKIPNNSSKETK